MPFNMHAATVPPMRHMLKSLSHILTLAERHCEARKIDPAVLVASRLFPDMLPLKNQVQIASDAAKGAAARLSGVPIPSFEDNEATLGDLQARIEKTIAFIDSVPPEKFEGSESRTITLQVRGTPREFTGQDFLLHWATPNFYFHVTTAYALLRHNGVEIGKSDYLSGGK